MIISRHETIAERKKVCVALLLYRDPGIVAAEANKGVASLSTFCGDYMEREILYFSFFLLYAWLDNQRRESQHFHIRK